MSNFFIVAREVHDEHEIRPDDPAHAMHMMSRACDTTLQTHGRMWRRLERRAALTYEAQTGIKVTSTFDWASIKQWLKDHWPQIVSMLCSIISVFILLGAKKAVGGPLGIPELVHELTNETQKVELLTDQVAQMVPAVNTLLQRGNDQAEIITNTIAQMRGDGLTLTTTIQSPWGPMTVPRGTFVALGDNRDDSRDSRTWGPVPLGQVKGRALFVYWSREPGERERFLGRGVAVRRFLDGAVHFFDQTRWPRTFRPIR